MKIAKLILHFETPEVTSQLLHSIPDAILIDNGSRPERRIVTDHEVIQLDRNYGFTAGWNKGVEAVFSRFDAFWLMNSDIVITRDNIVQMEAAFQTGGYDIATGQYNCWIKDCQPGQAKGWQQLPVIEFTAPIISKRLIEKIGYMDAENFARGYGVEFSYCHEATKAGFKIGCFHGAEFYHLGQTTIKSLTGCKDYFQEANAEHRNGMIKKYGSGFIKLLHSKMHVETDFEKKIAVYTTIFGDYETLKPKPWSQINAKWYCITDNPMLKSPGWETIVVNTPRPDLHPRLRAKFFKVFPWEVLPSDVDISIFIDGSTTVKTENFIEYCIVNLHSDMLMYKHPVRDCIFEEYQESKKLMKYRHEPLDAQIKFYRNIVKPHSGLYYCGCLVRKHTKAVKELMHSWWFENIKYSYQDQISFPVVAQLHNFNISTFKERQEPDNKHLTFRFKDGK